MESRSALQFLGSNRAVEPQGADRAPGMINDLRGSDPSQWHTQIPQFRDVVYPDLWPGIDLQLREQSGVLKYEFHVQPGASPSDIRLAYDGADTSASARPAGCRSRHRSACSRIRCRCPTRSIGGVQVPVSSHYELGDDEGFSFAVGSYQRDHELVIDPGVQYATFLGGNSDEKPANIAVDASWECVHRRDDAVTRLPDHHGRVRSHRGSTELRRSIRHQAQSRRHRARVLDVRRWQQHGVRPRSGDRRGRQRIRHRADEIVELPDDR